MALSPVLSLSLVILVAGACGSGSRPAAVSPPASAARTEDTQAEVPLPGPFVRAGEQLTFRVTWAGIEGGRARMAVGEPGADGARTVIQLRGEGQTSGVAALVREMKDASATWLDLASGTPARTESEAVFGERHSIVRSDRTREPDPRYVTLRLWRAQGKGPGKEHLRKQRLPDGAPAYDPMSSLLVLRAWRAPAGARADLWSLAGTRLWRTTLRHEGTTRVDTAIGARAAVKLTGVSTRMTPRLTPDPRPPRTFTVYISDDDERLPLLLFAATELGEVRVELTSHRPGTPTPPATEPVRTSAATR